MATAPKQALKVGIFVVSVAAIMVAALIVIGGLRFLRPVDTYYVVTDQGVSGIDLNSSVLLRGVAIGKVDAIELDRTNYAQVTVVLAIDPSMKIPAGSRAYFERVGLTGERVIDISGGTLADGALAPGSTLPLGRSELDVLQARAESLGDDLSALIADLRSTVDQVHELAAAIEPERVTRIVEAVDPERVESIVVHTEHASKTLAATSQQLERTVVEARADLDEITPRVDEVTDKAATVLEHADTILHANAADVRVTLQNLRSASQDAKALVEELRERPSLLLRSRPHGKRKKHKHRKHHPHE
jgi:ABC-type transporter Mla subunit MlaD